MIAVLQMMVFGLTLLSSLFLLLATCTDCWMVNADDSLEVSRAALIIVESQVSALVSVRLHHVSTGLEGEHGGISPPLSA